MKKLLAIVLVLGMASMASAALSLSGVPAQAMPGTYTLTISADDAMPYDFGIGVNKPAYDGGLVDLLQPVEGPATGDLFGTQDYRAGYAAWFISSSDGAAGNGDDLAAGDRAYVDLVVTGVAGSFDVILYNAQLGILDSQTVEIVPEPMTMSLLGLGGLGLLRRRRA